MAWYGMVDVDLYSAIITKVSNALNTLLLLLLKSVEFDDDVALLLSVAGLVVRPHVTSESEIGGTDSAALRTSRACLRKLCDELHVTLVSREKPGFQAPV